MSDPLTFAEQIVLGALRDARGWTYRDCSDVGEEIATDALVRLGAIEHDAIRGMLRITDVGLTLIDKPTNRAPVPSSRYIIELRTDGEHTPGSPEWKWNSVISVDLRSVSALQPAMPGVSSMWLHGWQPGRYVGADYDDLRRQWLAVRG